MIHLAQTNQVSEHVKERSKKMWVRTLSPDTYVVKPKEKGKARRIVRLLTSSAGVHIECSDKDSGELCPANAFGLHCAHSEAAINRLLINLKRKSNKQLKSRAIGEEKAAG